MPEEQAKINIRKQEVGRDLFNVAGNLIINSITKEPVHLPTIQSVLRKGEIKEGEFFRKEPTWIDYEKGFIVERREVNEIIKRMENEKVQLVLGQPASGKSTILKNVGYKLAKDGKKVHIIELKKHPQDEVKLFFENISKIDDESIFIVDDAHLYISGHERLAKEFKGKGNLIIGSRLIRELIEEHPKESLFPEFESLNKKAIHIRAEDVTEEMIRTFLEIKYQFNNEKIKTISDNVEKFKNDLWLLSWALKAYNPEEDSVEEDEIYKKIRDSIREIIIGEDEDKVPIKINAENILLPLSIFYRYEIPIERYFLEEQMGIEENIINQLIGLQETVETEEIGKHKMLSLHHSSLAKLYFGAYQRYPDLGRGIKKNILNGKDEEYLQYCSFYRYMTTITDPSNAFDVIIYLREDWSNANGGKILLEKLSKENKIQEIIKKGIEKQEDLDKIGICMQAIIFARESNDVAIELVNSINIDVFSTKIDKERDIGKIGRFVTAIAEVSKEVGLNLTNSIDINALSSKIEKEEDLDKIGFCVPGIAETNKEMGLNLTNSIDINALSSKIEKEEDLEMIGWFISGIAKANEKVGLRLIDTVLSKIEKEDDIRRIGWCVSDIARANEEMGLNLAERIDIDILLSKIEEEEDLEMIGRCVSGIAWASKEAGLELVNNIDIKTLSAKIEKEKDIKKIRECIMDFAYAKMAKSIDIGNLSSKIDTEESREKIRKYAESIAIERKKVTREIVNYLNPKLREELQKCMG